MYYFCLSTHGGDRKSRGESETGGSGFHFPRLLILFTDTMTEEEERGGRDLVTGSWLPVILIRAISAEKEVVSQALEIFSRRE